MEVKIPTNEDIPMEMIAAVKKTLNLLDFIDSSASRKRCK